MKAKPNFTAWFVLQGMLVAMRHARYAVRDEASLTLYEALAEASSKKRALSRLIYALPYGWQYKIGEFVTTRGRLRHYYLRKTVIEKHVRTLLSEGFTQVVILGAGLDVLALKLAKEYPNARFIEIDMKESQHFKTVSLASRGIGFPSNIELIEGDLRDPLAGILSRSKLHDKAAKTIWIGEGFFMFIPEESARDIFEQIQKNSAGESCCIFTTLPCKEQGALFARLLQKAYLKKEKSELNWAIDYHDVPGFMRALGYEVTAQMDYRTLHKDFLKSEGDHDIGENIHISRFSPS